MRAFSPFVIHSQVHEELPREQETEEGAGKNDNPGENVKGEVRREKNSRMLERQRNIAAHSYMAVSMCWALFCMLYVF